MVSIEHIETPAFLVEVLADGSFAYRDGNKALSDRTGLGRRLVRGGSPQDLLPEPFGSTIVAHCRDCVRSVAVLAFEQQFEDEGRTSHWRTTLIPIDESGTGRVVTILGIVSDITASKRAELELLRANSRLTLALQAIQGAHWEYDIQNHRFEASPTLALLFGEPEPRQIQLHEWIRLIPPGDRTSASFHALVAGTRDEQITRYRIVTASGEERWLKCRRLAVRDARRTVQIVFGVTVDVTDEVRTEQRLVGEAHRDGLTHLLNRSGFLARLDAMIADCERDSGALSVLMVDLDDFKLTNDTLGHAAGDAVLAAVGQRIAGMLQGADCAARLGGDEFAIAVRGRDAVRSEQMASRLRRRIDRPCSFRDAEIPVSASIGAVIWVPGQGTADVMEAADRSLYVDKRHKNAGGRRGETVPLRRSA